MTIITIRYTDIYYTLLLSSLRNRLLIKKYIVTVVVVVVVVVYNVIRYAVVKKKNKKHLKGYVTLTWEYYPTWLHYTTAGRPGVFHLWRLIFKCLHLGRVPISVNLIVPHHSPDFNSLSLLVVNWYLRMSTRTINVSCVLVIKKWNLKIIS